MSDVAVVLDVDGTLVDTSYLHVLAWDAAFSAVGLVVPHARIHRAIGMGGDRLVAEVAGDQTEHSLGDQIRDRHDAEFDAMAERVHAVPGAEELLAALRRRGLTVTVASSGPREQTDRALGLVDGDRYVAERTTSGDAEGSKPAPDLIDAVLDRVEADRAVVIGDAVWDMHAAKARGHHAVGVLTGGLCEGELTDAGADQVFASVGDLAGRLDELPLGSPPGIAHGSGVAGYPRT